MVQMTVKKAKLIVLLSQLPPECRYAEFLATKLQCNYSKLAGDIRSMTMAGWLWQERGVMFKRRKFLTINQTGLREAAIAFLQKEDAKSGA